MQKCTYCAHGAPCNLLTNQNFELIACAKDNLLEQFKPIVDDVNIGYEVSNLGRVRSTKRIVHRTTKLGTVVPVSVRPKILKLQRSTNGYVYVNLKHPTKRSVKKLIHSLVKEAFLGRSKPLVDHINHDKLNNRVSNLRLCTASENSLNTRKRNDDTTSNFKGVSYHSRDRVWVSSLTVNGLTKTLGSYETEIEAAVQYNMAAKKYGNGFAVLNNIPNEYKYLEQTMSEYRPKKLTSNFRGVGFNVKSGRWRARVNKSGKTINIGYFVTEVEAAKAYNDAAVEYLGSKAVLNKLPEFA